MILQADTATPSVAECFGCLTREVGMLFRRKPQWHGLLERCDHDVAASVLMHYVAHHHPSEPLAIALERYFQNPSYDTALPVIAADPQTILLFRESRPGGAYYRLAHANPIA